MSVPHFFARFPNIVNLNIGGQIFTTKLTTLTKDAGSIFRQLSTGCGSSDMNLLPDGSYFIDRDGTYFRYILNYLRTGKLILPDDKVIRKEVLVEAKFYQIQGIINKLTYSESEILSPEQQVWLTEAVGKTYDSFNLLYRASRDGWASRQFHYCCNGKGPTLVVIKSTDDYIFGGYTEQYWDSTETAKPDDEAFLFSLGNPALCALKPTKISVTPGRSDAILCSSSYGPCFGKPEYKGRTSALCIVDNPNKMPSKSFLGRGSYDFPTGQNGHLLAGHGSENGFLVCQIEVFEHVMDSY